MAQHDSSGKRSERRGTIDVPGGSLAYAVQGHGRPVVFIHAAIADGRMWERESATFASSRLTVRFDLRGYGASPPATTPFSPVGDLQAVVSGLGLAQPVLVGASMGGAMAIDFAVEHPNLVGGLLLVAPGLSGGIPPPYTPEEKAAFEEDDRRSQEAAQAWSKGDAPGAIEALRRLWCASLEGASLDLFRRMVEDNRAEVFENRSDQQAQPIKPPAAQRLGSIVVPTTVLVGDRDNPSMPHFARRIASGISGARLITVPGGDHLLNMSRPAAFDAALRAMLGEPS